MITLGVNADNSIYLDANGRLVLLSGAEALAQTLGQISKTRLNELMYNMTDGVAFDDTVFQTMDVLQFEATLREQFMAHSEVTGVESISVEQTGNTMSYTSKINSIYGVISING